MNMLTRKREFQNRKIQYIIQKKGKNYGNNITTTNGFNKS